MKPRQRRGIAFRRRHRCPLTGKSRKPSRYRCEALERRVLLSSIVWTNRGNASDGFNGVFGGNAELARNVVDAALLAWQNVIADFNQSDGANTLSLNISMVPTQNNGGAAGDFDELDGIPISASITLDSGSDGQGGGWFLDPTPGSNEEFRGDIINPFAGDAQFGSPAVGKFDLYTVVASEVCHALGLNPDGDQLFNEDPGGFLVNTGQGDAAFPGKGTLYRFTSPNVRMLYTSNNGGATGTDTGDPVHIAEPVPGNIGNVGPDFYFGIEDVNNAQYEGNRRYLPSWHTALILQDVYGFTLNNIASFANFYANFDPGTGDLLLRGGQPGDAIYQPSVPSDDNFNIVKSAGALVVAQDIGNDVPGALPTGYIISQFNAGLVDTVTIDTGDGNDSVIIGVDGDFQLNSTQVLTGSQTYSYANLESMTLSGNFITADTVRIDGTDTSVSYTINTFGGNDIIDVEGASAGSGLWIDGGDDADTLYFGFIGADLDNTAGQISFIGGNGFDVIRVQDQADNTDNNYRLSSGGLAEGAFRAQRLALGLLRLRGRDRFLCRGWG
jgi:hypothetical protein